MQERPEGFRPKRRWGQNFLASPATAERIIAAFLPCPGDRVLEIGPGRGALTRLLAGRVARLVAVEVDPILASSLAEDLEGHPAPGAGAPTVTIVPGDILGLDLDGLLAGLQAGAARRVRVIANLPYNIATAVILRLLAERQRIGDLLVMVQREVAERILSPSGRRSYGSLSVICQTLAQGERILRLGPGAFRPRPKVESQVIQLRPRTETELPPARVRGLNELLRSAFATRRKTLLNNLARLPARGGALGTGRAGTALRAAGIDPRDRPEAVPPAAYLELLRALRDL